MGAFPVRELPVNTGDRNVAGTLPLTRPSRWPCSLWCRTLATSRVSITVWLLGDSFDWWKKLKWWDTLRENGFRQLLGVCSEGILPKWLFCSNRSMQVVSVYACVNIKETARVGDTYKVPNKTCGCGVSGLCALVHGSQSHEQKQK